MAIRKILGIETEYGILSSDKSADPIVTSTLLVNAYAHHLTHRVAWDFEDESPHRDARGTRDASARAPVVERDLANTVLTNGARFYVDHAHPEYSSPECSTALEALRYDLAGESICRDAMAMARVTYPSAPEIVLYKNNSDHKGQSYGCHENYLVDRGVPFDSIITALVPHLITRQLYCGAGKLGHELTKASGGDKYQLSQRSEFFEAVVGLETTIKRPIINTRDEPHADSSRYRRLHVIIGDSNMSHVATFLKIATTAVILAMLEDGALPESIPYPFEPVRALHAISADTALRHSVETDQGKLTALEIQWQYFEAASIYLQTADLEFCGGEEQATLVLTRWREALSGLERDPDSMASTIDWVAKRRLMDGYAQRHGLSDLDPKLHMIDLQYHDLRIERSLALRAGLDCLIDASEIPAAMVNPPEDTRAWFRGRVLSQFPQNVVCANWDSLVLDIGTDPLQRIPMMDPLRGNKASSEALFREAKSAKQLIDLLAHSKR